MNTIYVLTFLFAFGCLFGWCLELVYRRFAEQPKKWLNPGFLHGPYLPIYGFGLLSLYVIANFADIIPCENVLLKNIFAIVGMGFAMTLIEYIAGIIFIKKMGKKLWDYSDKWGNIDGIICPLFSFYWTILSIVYLYVLHPYMSYILDIASKWNGTAFILGIFYLIFVTDIIFTVKKLKTNTSASADA